MTTKIISKTLLVLLIFILTAGETANAMPAKRGNMTFTMPNGKTITVKMFGDEHHHYFTTTDGYIVIRSSNDMFTYALPVGNTFADSKIEAANESERTSEVVSMLNGIDRNKCMEIMDNVKAVKMKRIANRIAPEAGNMAFPTKGSPRLLAVLVEFTNKKFSLPNPVDAFQRYLNERGYNDFGATGSIADWLYDSSNGQFTPQFDLYGPITLANDMNYYGGNDAYGDDKNAYMMAVEACQQLDDVVDFSVYDTDNDGVIDNIYIFYPGYGEHDNGPAYSVWPHSWDLEYATDKVYTFDGKRLNHYACSNELAYDPKEIKAVGIGLFCHEFSHVLGLPDMYCTDAYTTDPPFTPGRFTIMDYGGYNNDYRTPPLHTGYERYCLGWLEPEELTGEREISIGAISDKDGYNDVKLITTPRTNEYYILENRQQKAWDKYILGHGMLVWHINYAAKAWEYNIVNKTLQNIDIVEADNIEDDPYDVDGPTVDGDTFPGSAGVTSLTDDTTPSITPRTKKRLNKGITDISESNGVITFMFKDSNSTGVNSAVDAPSVTCRTNGSGITVTAASEVFVRITDAAGRCMVTAKQQSGTQTYNITAGGLYIVKAGSNIFKMIL